MYFLGSFVVFNLLSCILARRLPHFPPTNLRFYKTIPSNGFRYSIGWTNLKATPLTTLSLSNFFNRKTLIGQQLVFLSLSILILVSTWFLSNSVSLVSCYASVRHFWKNINWTYWFVYPKCQEYKWALRSTSHKG